MQRSTAKKNYMSSALRAHVKRPDNILKEYLSEQDE
jgi:hypothetical protein